MPEIVAIVGSRKFPNLELVRKFVAGLPLDVTIVSGGASGVDSVAVEAAKERGMEIIECHADWDGLGRKAGPIRNHQIVMAADRVIAFWDGVSRGTLNSVRIAHDIDKPVVVINVDGEEVLLETALDAALALNVKGMPMGSL